MKYHKYNPMPLLSDCASAFPIEDILALRAAALRSIEAIDEVTERLRKKHPHLFQPKEK